MNDWWSTLFNFSDFGALVTLEHNSIIAGAILGVVGGLVGVFVMTREGERALLTARPVIIPSILPGEVSIGAYDHGKASFTLALLEG